MRKVSRQRAGTMQAHLWTPTLSLHDELLPAEVKVNAPHEGFRCFAQSCAQASRLLLLVVNTPPVSRISAPENVRPVMVAYLDSVVAAPAPSTDLVSQSCCL
jgi:hypothetical protein